MNEGLGELKCRRHFVPGKEERWRAGGIKKVKFVKNKREKQKTKIYGIWESSYNETIGYGNLMKADKINEKGGAL